MRPPPLRFERRGRISRLPPLPPTSLGLDDMMARGCESDSTRRAPWRLQASSLETWGLQASKAEGPGQMDVDRLTRRLVLEAWRLQANSLETWGMQASKAE